MLCRRAGGPLPTYDAEDDWHLAARLRTRLPAINHQVARPLARLCGIIYQLGLRVPVLNSLVGSIPRLSVPAVSLCRLVNLYLSSHRNCSFGSLKQTAAFRPNLSRLSRNSLLGVRFILAVTLANVWWLYRPTLWFLYNSWTSYQMNVSFAHAQFATEQSSHVFMLFLLIKFHAG